MLKQVFDDEALFDAVVIMAAEERTDFYFPDWPFNVFIFIVYILGLYIITSLRTP